MLTQTHQAGAVPELLRQVQRPECPRCERCGCGLCGDPGQLMVCSTCLPAEVVELRAKLAVYEAYMQSLLSALAERQRMRKAVPS